MKFSKIALAVVGMMVLGSAAQAADSGTITFNGLITAATCEVTNDASGSWTVTLPTVRVGDFAAAAGSTAGSSNFRIGVKNCAPASGTVRAHFQYEATQTDLSSGQLLLQTGSTATNVRLQLFNVTAPTTIIRPGDAGSANAFPIAADGTGEMIYGVQYIKPTTAAPTAGTVVSRVNYKLSYN